MEYLNCVIASNFFNLLITFSVSGVIAFGLIKYLSKKIFENYLAKQLESHIKDLEKLNIAYQIQFSSLHKKKEQFA